MLGWLGLALICMAHAPPGAPAAPLRVLHSVGGTMDDIAKVTVFVTDVTEIVEIHAVRAEFFRKPYPASTLVQVAQLIDPDWLIEIEAVAVIPQERIAD